MDASWYILAVGATAHLIPHTFSSSNPPTQTHPTDTLIPFSSLGMEDSIYLLGRIPLQSFLLRVFRTTRPPTSLPLIWPFYNSLEKQYYTFGTSSPPTYPPMTYSSSPFKPQALRPLSHRLNPPTHPPTHHAQALLYPPKSIEASVKTSSTVGKSTKPCTAVSWP